MKTTILLKKNCILGTYSTLVYALLFLTFSNSYAQVGIGTTTPDVSSALEINSNSAGLLIPRVSLLDIANGTTPINSPAISLLVYNTNAAVTGGSGIGYYTWNGTAWTKLLTSLDDKWTRNGFGQMYPTTITDNIGIGTSSPSTNLHIVSNSSNPMIIDGNGSLFVTLAENGLNRGYIGSFVGNPEDVNFGTYGGNTGALHLSTNNTARVTALYNGNVGVGTTTPTENLQLANNMKIGNDVWSTATNDRFLKFGDGNFVTIGEEIGDDILSFKAKNFIFNPSSFTSGNVGIGTTTPNAQLQFSNTVSNRKIVLYEGANNDHQYYGFGINGGILRYQTYTTADDHVFFSGVNATTSNELMRVKGNGNVGIGTTTPTEKLEVNGKIKITDGFQATGKVLTSDAAGVATWQPIGINNISASLTSGVNVPYNTSNFLQTGTSITLPPGRYAVNVTMLLTNPANSVSPANSSFWLRSTFSDSSAANPLPSSNIQGAPLVSGNLPGSSVYSLMNGTVVINNNTGANKTYYYVAGRTVTVNTTDTVIAIGGSLGENNIIAYKLQ